ncbi:MAG: EAL domain-containing protein [Actinobacteria bacterium]|nr:EAL domain-containing protein [Actinomycetota bacterium]MCA1720727.1 EAL domain-containing protein [Actinomycetota bacterium]
MTRERSARGVPSYDAVALWGFVLFLCWVLLPGRAHDARQVVSSVSFVVAPAAAAWRCWRAAQRGGGWTWTWRLLAVATGVWAVGSACWDYLELRSEAPAPFPSVADAAYLVFPVLGIAALLALPAMPRRAAPAARLLLDGVAAAAALLLLARFGPLSSAVGAGVHGLARVVATAYPSCDVLAGAVVLVVLDRLRTGMRHPGVLVAVAFAVACASDLTYAMLSTHGGYVAGGPLDALWAGSFLLIGVAAGLPEPAAPTASGPRRHLLPTLPAVLAIGVLLLSQQLLEGLDRLMMAYVVALGASLAARQHLLGAENRDLHRSLELRVDQRTTELRHAREVFRHRAYTDALTGLGNRDAFHEALADVAQGASGAHVAVVLLDLDGFKQVNDGFGHDVGDEVLVALADRLRGCLRSADHGRYDIARLGGDEFACLLRDLNRSEDADVVAARLVAAMRQSVVVRGHEFFLGASAGVAVARTPFAGSPRELLREADTAMYAAKDGGGNRSRTFDARMHSRVVEQVALEADLHRALDEGEIYVHFQPVFDLAHGRLTGVEALARWTSPTRGEVSPVEFIPVAERTGLIVDLERQVLDQVCEQMVRWRQVLPDLKAGVNFSARHLREPDLLPSVLACAGRHGLPASAIVAEVTESLFFSDEDVVAEVLQSLDAAGIVLALDDFGTGYSSLSRLSRHPFRILKVDRSFLAEVVEGGRPPTILLATLSMARGLGLDVVAEGVETQAQLDFLMAHGCGFAQGYLLGRPGAAEKIGSLLLEQLIPTQG